MLFWHGPALTRLDGRVLSFIRARTEKRFSDISKFGDRVSPNLIAQSETHRPRRIEMRGSRVLSSTHTAKAGNNCATWYGNNDPSLVNHEDSKAKPKHLNACAAPRRTKRLEARLRLGAGRQDRTPATRYHRARTTQLLLDKILL